MLRRAFPTPRCLSPPRRLAPPALLGGCAVHAEAGREPGSLCLPLAETLTPGPLSQSQDPIEGQNNFQRHPLAVRTGHVSQKVPRDPRQHALTVSCVGLCVLRSALLLEGGVHAHMDWHAHSNPLPSHCCPSDAQERSGSCSCLLPQSENWRLPRRSAFYSNVRDIIGNFKKMLKPWGGQEKYPFFL